MSYDSDTDHYTIMTYLLFHFQHTTWNNIAMPAILSISFHKAAYSKMFQTTIMRVIRKHVNVHAAWLARVFFTLTKIWPDFSKIWNIHGLQIYNNNLLKVLYLYKLHYYNIMYNKSSFTAKTLTASLTNTSVFKDKPWSTFNMHSSYKTGVFISKLNLCALLFIGFSAAFDFKYKS
jgi:hypothetical protein